jgi:hypothetical protein
MAIKKICQLTLLSIGLFNTFNVHAQDSPFGQTFQINTHLNSFVGKPSWLIIIRDVTTGQVLPFLYDFNTTENFWLGFTFAHAYQVTVSDLEFGPPNTVIHNFCHLQDGILDRESFTINLTGDLTPNRHTSFCHIFKYKEYAFPIVQAQSDSGTEGGSNGANAAAPQPTGPALGTATENLNKMITSTIGSGVSSGIGNAVNGVLHGTAGK